jgi:RHH-type transcriptional regulator, proline utilization regulon repressor / proline dehydrogenase / delta 1-pyrroline-5-carboxylate dehydrogenase
MAFESGPSFSAFAAETIIQPPLRYAITQAYRRPEPDCLPPLIVAATLPEVTKTSARAMARQLVTTLRAKHQPGGVEALVQEYALSTEEGVALMCLAEALLRIPDTATRDALIRDKIGGGDWRTHLGHSPSLFVNAASWGLVITGRLTATASETTLSGALVHLLARGGEPIIRQGVDLVMRMMGEQFVMGKTIEQALARAKPTEARGFRYSYDMLGEAALTAEDAGRYFIAYEQAIHAIGAAARGRGLYEGPGISIKLSALHPRYTRAQRGRVLAELLPRLTTLARLAREQNIGLNIDAEEADRLDLSLDLLEALCSDPDMTGWDGIGFVVQAYQKRAIFVIDHLIGLAHRSNHRLMIRLVKGAYWDTEIKCAQADGLADFPVFTRKIHTDISYIACAKKLLEAGAAVYPQFATHNALTLTTIQAMAPTGDYEFQCLHGMGEALYGEVTTHPCRIYAPVGTHDTLLAYLVRRLLENGANTSFVNRLADPAVTLDALLQDPIEQALLVIPIGAPHDKIPRPPNLFGSARKNSTGFDFSNEASLRDLAKALSRSSPADTAQEFATAAMPMPPRARAACLIRAAALLKENRVSLLRLLVQEGQKTIPNAISEIRESVDFLRYYAAQIHDWRAETDRPLGVVVCISPWNFPLSIFLGQVAAAFAAGNIVRAKPAEETPRIAALAANLLVQAGIPLQLIQGDGATGAALVADPSTAGVVFTGSTDTARLIQRELGRRTSPQGKPILLIAETGGQNAMIVDSSALPEQVVTDALYSAFDSAGQRCSSLRVLCVQDAAAPRILSMLHGAIEQLTIGPPDRLATDIGPVISAAARQNILSYIEAMRRAGHKITQVSAPEHGLYVPPTIIEIPGIATLTREVFGPVLHVLKFRRSELDALVDDINATGHGLTFGLHTRIDETINRVTARIRAGNIYVNRNIVGAVVGVQPFGGHGLSGTGPKAGGPLYLHRLLASGPETRPAGQELPGPVGERNLYSLAPRGAVLCLSKTPEGREAQRAAVLASGNRAVFGLGDDFDAALLEGDASDVLRINAMLAGRPGPIIALHALSPAETAAGEGYNPAWLLTERVISTNTAAAGGNASLMALG